MERSVQIVSKRKDIKCTTNIGSVCVFSCFKQRPAAPMGRKRPQPRPPRPPRRQSGGSIPPGMPRRPRLSLRLPPRPLAGSGGGDGDRGPRWPFRLL